MKSIGNKLRKKLKEQKGIATLNLSIFLTMLILIIFATMIEFYRGYIIVSGVADAVDRAVISTAASNAYTAFAGVREGNATLYEVDEGNLDSDDLNQRFQELVSVDDVTEKLISNNKVTLEHGDTLPRYKDDLREGFEYRIHDLVIEYENPEADADFGDGVIFRTTYTLELPLTFLGVLPLNISLGQVAVTEWIPKF